MKERDDQTPLSGVIEVDDVYWGGEAHGDIPGHGSPNKTPFIAALSRNDEDDPIGLRLGKVKGFRKAEVEPRAPVAQDRARQRQEQLARLLPPGERRTPAALPR